MTMTVLIAVQNSDFEDILGMEITNKIDFDKKIIT